MNLESQTELSDRGRQEMELALAQWPREGHIEPSVGLDLEEFSEFEAKRSPSMLRIGVHRIQRQGPSGHPCTYLSPRRSPD